MEQSPSLETNMSSANQEIPCILCNPWIRYSIHKCPPPFPVLSQSSPIHASPSHFFTININIFLPSMPRSSKVPLSLRSCHQNNVCTCVVLHTCHIPRPSQSTSFLYTALTNWCLVPNPKVLCEVQNDSV